MIVDILQEDVFLRFLASSKSDLIDRYILVLTPPIWQELEPQEGVFNPTVVSTMTIEPIAVGNQVLRSINGTLFNRQFFDTGVTRFTLQDDEASDWLSLKLNWQANVAWLLQASNIFRSCEIPRKDDLRITSRMTAPPSTIGLLRKMVDPPSHPNSVSTMAFRSGL
ncbi:hypothetical protein PM082_020112 [Marasmius tenuissimus]|nr:hypothetical protein PM082_020112 [Marasmius tenuissimus]